MLRTEQKSTLATYDELAYTTKENIPTVKIHSKIVKKTEMKIEKIGRIWKIIHESIIRLIITYKWSMDRVPFSHQSMHESLTYDY